MIDFPGTSQCAAMRNYHYFSAYLDDEVMLLFESARSAMPILAKTDR